MSRRNSRRHQQAMNARRRAGAKPVDGCFLWFSGDAPAPKPLRVIQADPDTFPWYRGFGPGPVFRRMDGSAIGPVEVGAGDLADGGSWVQWEIVEVRP